RGPFATIGAARCNPPRLSFLALTEVFRHCVSSVGATVRHTGSPLPPLEISMARARWPIVLVLGILFPVATGEASAQPATPNAKITSALSAAPPSIADKATIMDWPATAGGQPIQLRAGTNGWVCFPD